MAQKDSKEGSIVGQGGDGDGEGGRDSSTSDDDRLWRSRYACQKSPIKEPYYTPKKPTDIGRPQA